MKEVVSTLEQLLILANAGKIKSIDFKSLHRELGLQVRAYEVKDAKPIDFSKSEGAYFLHSAHNLQMDKERA